VCLCKQGFTSPLHVCVLLLSPPSTESSACCPLLLRRCCVLWGITASEGRPEAMGSEAVAGECMQCMHAVAMQHMGACMDTAGGPGGC
jgi:hypothetical protein